MIGERYETTDSMTYSVLRGPSGGGDPYVSSYLTPTGTVHEAHDVDVLAFVINLVGHQVVPEFHLTRLASGQACLYFIHRQTFGQFIQSV